MTTREKTVEYAFDFDANVVAATTFRTFGPITLTLSENSSRVFKSVFAYVCESSNRTTAASNGTAPIIGVQLAAVAFADTTLVIDGNGQNYDSMTQNEYEVDMTSYFNTNFGSGATQTCSVRVKFPESTVNCSVKLVVTYYYDDADATHVKTAYICLAGGTGVLGTSLAEIGTNEIPALDSFLPEASVSIKNVFAETAMLCRDVAATFTVGFALDAAASTDDGTHQTGSTATGAMYGYKRIMTLNSMTTNATHAFKAKSTVAATAYNVCVILVVTYTFDPSTTTRVLESLILPSCEQAALRFQMIGTLARTKRDRWMINIQGANPTLVQSGIRWQTWQTYTGSTVNLKFRCGSQSYQAYTNPMISSFPDYQNQVQYQQRIDSGSAQGAGLTIARGVNMVYADYYADGADSNDEVHDLTAPVMYLNVIVDKNASGVGVHNKTIKWLFWQSSIPTFSNVSPAWSVLMAELPNINPTVPESNWCFTSGFGFRSIVIRLLPQINVKLLSGEQGATGAIGWINVDSPCANTLQSDMFYSCSSKKWDRWASDPDTDRLNPFSTRTYSITPVGSNTGQNIATSWLYSYHSMTYTVGGLVYGYTGTGAGITVNAHRADTGEVVATSTTSVGGSYSITVYDNTISYYVEAYQDAAHLGRSNNGTPV